MSTKTRLLVLLAASVVGVGALNGVAQADGVRVVVPLPMFYPTPQFRYDNGYYRTNEGHYYHYDRDRDGWHYGRNHGEGERYERRHERH